MCKNNSAYHAIDISLLSKPLCYKPQSSQSNPVDLPFDTQGSCASALSGLANPGRCLDEGDTARGVGLVWPRLAWVEAGSFLAGSFVVRGSSIGPMPRDKSPPLLFLVN